MEKFRHYKKSGSIYVSSGFSFCFIPRLLQNLFYCGVLKVKQYACVKKNLFGGFFAEYGNEIFKNYIVAVGKEFFHVGVGACSPGKYG